MMFLSFVATIEVIIMAFVKRILMKTKQAEKSKAEKKGKKTSSKKGTTTPKTNSKKNNSRVASLSD